MNIEDAFTSDAIEDAGTNIEGEEEEAVRNMITRVLQANEMELTEEQMNIALLCFIAGRTYQVDAQAEVMVKLPVSALGEFMTFLLNREG